MPKPFIPPTTRPDDPVVRAVAERRGTRHIYDADEVLDLMEGVDGGATISNICDVLGISRTLYTRWLKDHPEFKDAVDRAKARATDKVIESMHRSATGYTAVDVKRERNPNTNEMEVVAETIREHRPDNTAARFFLTNVDPANWTNKQVVEHTDDTFLARLARASAGIVDLPPDAYREIDE